MSKDPNSLTSTPVDSAPDSATDSPLDSALFEHIAQRVTEAGGWLPFDDFMARALYTPGLGYYANDSRKFGSMPESGSDFVTAPELTPLFGQTLAAQVAQALAETGTNELWEFGAGSGALALQLLQTLDGTASPPTALPTLPPARYTIVDLSGSLRARQQATLAGYGDRVRWVSELPDAMQGVVVGNEVLDAMPVKLLARVQGAWFERGVALFEGQLHWADQPTDLRPPHAIDGEHDYLTEIHPQAEAFVRTLAERLGRGAAFFIDYGFPEHEYYHPQRHMGTVMCHRAHQAGGHPLRDLGLQDITAHVNFTGIALAAQDAGFEVLGYTSQARFLINCGLLSNMELTNDTNHAESRSKVHVLILEHEMGELFKVIGLVKSDARAAAWSPMGFGTGDRVHTL
jgi:SAM-dependent MidA family methyltransferase